MTGAARKTERRMAELAAESISLHERMKAAEGDEWAMLRARSKGCSREIEKLMKQKQASFKSDRADVVGDKKKVFDRDLR